MARKAVSRVTTRRRSAGGAPPGAASGAIDELLHNLAAATSTVTGAQFFGRITEYLARALDADFVFVGELAADRQSVRTLSVYSGGRQRDNFDYALAHTPCEQVTADGGEGICTFADDVQQKFPRDHLLIEMGVVGYSGIALRGADGRALGLLAVLSRRPLADVASAELLLRIMAGRAAVELERQRAERHAARLNRLLGTVSAVHRMLLNETEPGRVLQETCRILVEQGGLRMAWVGRADSTDGSVTVMAQAGAEPGYLAEIKVRCDDSAFAQGPTGRAIRTGESVINNDIETSPAFAPWRASARRLGYRASAAFPLRMGEGGIGAVNLYAAQPGAFGTAEVALFEELVATIGQRLQAIADAEARARADAALHAREAGFRLLFEHNPLPMYIYDRATYGFLAVNDAALRHYGYTREEFLALDLFAIRPPEEVPRLKQVLAGNPDGLYLGTRWRHRRKNGEVFDVEITGHRIAFEGRDAEFILALDVTERLRAERRLRESQAELAQAQKVAHLGTWTWDIVKNEAHWSEETCRLYGVAPGARLDVWAVIEERVHPEDKPRLYETMQACARDGSPRPLEFRVCLPNGTQRTLYAEGEAQFDASGKPVRMFGTVLDVTARKQAEARMRQLSSAMEQTADTVVITDRRGIIEYVNPAYERTTGYSRAEAIGARPSLVKSGRHDAAFYAELWRTIAAGGIYRNVVINRRKDGSLYYEEKTITPLKDERGAITHFVSTGKDITERMQVQERLQYLAHHDELTRLPNRVLLLDRLDQALIRAHFHHRILAVLFLDLDHFKNINDTLGHNVGDQCLEAMAARVSQCVREGDTVARLGGDEFAILLEDIAQIEDISLVARKILGAFATSFTLDGRELFITTSIGVALYPNDGEDAHTLLKNADAAMYRAKELGRNNFQFYSADMSARAFERLTLETHLRHALERGQFVLYYQPQVELASGRITGMEVLIRWQHPEFGLLGPQQFIALAEDTGLIVPIGAWVVRTACHQAYAWRAAGLGAIRVAVNLAPRQFNEPDFVERMRAILDDCGADGSLLELEFTEGTIMKNAPHTVDKLRALSELGVRFAIDDFGTGYSSLSYLSRFPIHTLKIDKSFVRNTPGDANDTEIVKTIIAMAHSLKLAVIAEGVEERVQLAFLREQGCDLAQGYLFARPLPLADATRLLEAKAPLAP